MNWLAHAFLSEPAVGFRLGNLLADLVKGRDREGMPAGFIKGMRRHQRIDVFTDAHEVVHRSRGRICEDFRRVRGILVDVFYDHFLALEWERYTSEPLGTFTARVYADTRRHPISLPEEARAVMERMASDDLLGSYRRLEGIEAALRRLSLRLHARTGRNLGLERGVSEVVAHFEGLRADFIEFFPQLQSHVAEVGESEPLGGADRALLLRGGSSG